MNSSLFLSPGAQGPPPTLPPEAEILWFEASWGDFLPLPNALRKLHRKNIENRAKIEDFGLPKPFPNPPKIDPKSSLEKTLDFSSVFVRFLFGFSIFDFLEMCVLPQ